MLIALNKPFGVICKFSPEPGKQTLADFIEVPRVYPAGRLDTDSEGLLLLTDDGALQARISSPKFKLAKIYWAQVEGAPTAEALAPLRQGVAGMSASCTTFQLMPEISPQSCSASLGTPGAPRWRCWRRSRCAASWRGMLRPA